MVAGTPGGRCATVPRGGNGMGGRWRRVVTGGAGVLGPHALAWHGGQQAYIGTESHPGPAQHTAAAA